VFNVKTFLFHFSSTFYFYEHVQVISEIALLTFYNTVVIVCTTSLKKTLHRP